VSYLLLALDFSGVKKSTTNSFSKCVGVVRKGGWSGDIAEAP